MASKYTSKGRNEIDIKRSQTRIIAKFKKKMCTDKNAFSQKKKVVNV